MQQQRRHADGIGRADALDEFPRTPKDVSAADPFLVPKRAGIAERQAATLGVHARTRSSGRADRENAFEGHGCLPAKRAECAAPVPDSVDRRGRRRHEVDDAQRRVNRATAVGRQARAADNVPRTCGPGLMACRWRSG